MAQLLSTNVSGTLAVTQNTTVSGNLIVSGYNVLNEIFQADNLARVTANSGSAQSAVSLNFVNTATVTVSVTSGGAGVANIGFTSLVSGGVTSVGTGIGLTGGPITSTGTISANIASTTGQGVTKLIDSVTTNDAANAATAASVKTAFDQATLAYGQANSAYTTANSAANTVRVTANSLFAQSAVSLNFINTASITVSVGSGTTGNANVAFSAIAGSTAVPGILQLTDSVTSTSTTTAATPNSVKTAFDQATLAYGQANTAVTIGGSAYTQANAAYSAANNAANTVRVTANSGTAQSAVSLNFVNTATIRVNVGGGTTGNANVSFDYIGSVISGGSGINTFPVSVNSVSPPVTANGLNFLNSAFILASVSPGTTGNANVTLSLTQNVTLDTLTVTNLQNTSSNIFVRNSRLIASNIGSPTTTLNQQYGTIHIGDAGGSYQYSNVGGFALNQNANGSIYAFDGYNKSNGSAASISTWLQVGSDSATKYVSLGVSNTQGFVYGSQEFNIGYNVDNVGANLRIQGGSGGSLINVLFMAANGQSSFNYPVLIQSVNVVPSIANAGNTVRVTANSLFAQSAVSLNFINTASIQVSVGAGTTGNANVGFSAIAGSTTVAGILQLTDSVTSTSTTTAATPNSVRSAFDQATLAYGQANSAYTTANSAANTVRVTANSGSAQSAVGLNFNNTATIRVNVGAGSTGNANVSFDYIGSVSVTGGSGINTFPVSANSGSTVTANGLNFVNTSYSTVSVSPGTTGNANVVITPIGVQTQNYASVYSNKQMMEWAHNRDGKIFRIFGGTFVANTPSGVFANTSGTRFYVIDDGTDLIYQLNLSEAWNIASAATETANLSLAGQETQGQDLFLSNTGSILYVLGDGGNDITWYDLSQSWNVQTATANSQFSVSGQTTAPRGMFFKEDGTKFWVTSATTVFQYTMTSPWNLATAAYESISLVTTVDTSLQSISIDPTGSKMYLVGSTNDRIYEFNLSTPFNVSTGTYNNFSFLVRDIQTTTGQTNTETSATGLFIAYPNNRMYIVGTSQDAIIQYEMDRGITIEAKRLFANGRAHFMDDITVFGDVTADETIFAQSAQLGTTGQCVIGTTGNMTTSGSLSVSSATSDLGTSTANSTYTIGSGATVASRIKTIDIGTGGVSGSATNITLGALGVVSNVNINANTTTFSNTVNIGNQLVVSGLNILSELGIAENTARVSANSGPSQDGVAINFINTDSILVSVGPGATGNANVGFSLNTTALRTIWVPAQSMVSRTTAGAGTSTTEGATNRVIAKTLDFDTTTQEFAQFSIRMPKSWNLGTVSFAPYWTALGTNAGNVHWTLAGTAVSDNQAIDTAFGGAQTSIDIWQTANNVHIGPEPTTPITIGNAPVAGDIVFFQVSRDVANDTLDRDARLLGISLFVTVNARDDR